MSDENISFFYFKAKWKPQCVLFLIFSFLFLVNYFYQKLQKPNKDKKKNQQKRLLFICTWNVKTEWIKLFDLKINYQVEQKQHSQNFLLFLLKYQTPPTATWLFYTISNKQHLKKWQQHTSSSSSCPSPPVLQSSSSSLAVQFGHFLQVNPDALTVKQDKVNVFQGWAGGRHKVVGNGLEDELSRRLLWKTISVRKKKKKFRDSRSLRTKVTVK